MKSKITKTLKILLLLSVIFAFITLFQIFANIIGQRPVWLIILQIIPLPFFLFILTIISLDLVKQDYVTIKGKLVKKLEYTVGILIGNGEVKKFRVNKAFVKGINELKLNQEIEIQYYRRTKAVTQIKRLIEPELKNVES